MSDFPVRKRNRLKGYDYSQNGVYFLTLCTKNKKCILGRIVGDGDSDVPNMVLSEYGRITEKYIQSIESAYSTVTLDSYVIMPNHIHLVIELYSEENICKKTLSKDSANNTIPVVVSAFKRLVSKEVGYNFWQRSYHDHIIRNEAALNTIREYVANNQLRWKEDCFYCV
ncbi:MAG: transposase [Clostridia bacterium]|nr:transposase [Clostridia bacterium]